MTNTEALQKWAFAPCDKSEQWDGGDLSKQEAFDECLACYGSGYVAPCVTPKIPDISSSVIIDLLYDAMQDSDDAIEQSTDWLSKVDDKHLDHLEKWVNEAIEKWFDLHPQYKPKWFLVDFQRAEEVIESDVDQ